MASQKSFHCVPREILHIIAQYLEDPKDFKAFLSSSRGIYETLVGLVKTRKLHLGAKNGNTKLICDALSAGARLNSRTIRGDTPLLLAVKNGHSPVVPILTDNNARVEERDCNGYRPLGWAVQMGHLTIVKQLLAAGADIEGDGRGDDAPTPLMIAIQGRRHEIVEILLEHKASTEVLDITLGLTPLCWAARLDDADSTTLLIGSGAVVDWKDSDGRTALMYACEFGSKDCAKILLQYETDKDRRDNKGQSALFWAVRSGRRSITNLLIEQGFGLESTNHKSQTPLGYAVISSNLGVVNVCLARGADIAWKDRRGRNALMHAAWRGDLGITKRLIDYHIDLHLKDDSDHTAFFWVVEGDKWDLRHAKERNLYERMEIVQIFIKNGAEMQSAERTIIIGWATANDLTPLLDSI